MNRRRRLIQAASDPTVLLVPERDPGVGPTDSGAFRFGLDATVTGSRRIVLPAVGWFFVPGTGPATVKATIYDGATPVATSGTVSTAAFVAGWNQIEVDTPHAVDPAGSFSVVCYIPGGQYKYDNPVYLPVVSDDGALTVTGGRYESNDGGLPVNTWFGAHGLAVAYYPA